MTRSRQLDELKRLEAERAKNETELRPGLGHPNLAEKFENLNTAELKRQENATVAIDSYSRELRKRVRIYSEKFLKELGKTNESLLIKLDDLLSLDDLKMHGIIKNNFLNFFSTYFMSIKC